MTFSCRMQTITMEPAIQKRCMEETMMILILEDTIQEVMEEVDQAAKMLALKTTTAENIALQEF